MKQFIFTILLIAGTVLTAMHLTQTKAVPKKKPRKVVVPVVEVFQPKKQHYTVSIYTAGTVEAHAKTSIVSEVSGKIAYLSPDFQEGEYFKKGQVLARLEGKNYRNAITLALAEIKQKQLALQDTKNQAALSSNQWKLYSKSRQESELAALKIKISSAASVVHAAKIRLMQAKEDLAKINIIAPYSGRVLSLNVGIGQYISPAAKLGNVYSTRYVEVRLPLSLSQFNALDLPENYRDARSTLRRKKVSVSFYTSTSKQASSKKSSQWTGEIVRSSPAMDERTRQIAVIARINDPFKKPKKGGSIVKIGQFLQAKIKTKTLKNIFILSNRSVRQQKEVLLFNQGKIQVEAVKILHTEGDQVIISTKALPKNPQIITTPMARATTGTAVRVYKPLAPISVSKDPKKEK